MCVLCIDHVCPCDFIFKGRKDSYPVDITRSHSLSQIHVSQRRVELWHRSLGGDVLWREAILGDVQSGCKYMQFPNYGVRLRNQVRQGSAAKWDQVAPSLWNWNRIFKKWNCFQILQEHHWTAFKALQCSLKQGFRMEAKMKAFVLKCNEISDYQDNQDVSGSVWNIFAAQLFLGNISKIHKSASLCRFN